ncbi:MAG: class C beta-lactamase-related serine hydrolase [Runella slithyformis]|nr:MAG: class C beta-lactamase-related serine hydrolase [Runella slithyformis]TAF24566.1 MAG: class C beta-lactamase-related serine hydrolase [Runella slithyformis]TAF49466.1 MAG: class C beta-lactamase-related serine hydrolase [Runella slithyformis]TAF79310.1 MAG: class C beta-lactamase-related serine hydrolase [Runella slithyformis]
MKNTMIVLLLGLAAMFTNCAKVSIKSVEDLDATISNTFKKSPMVGCAISIVKADQVLFQKAYGQADMARNTPYTNQTTQPIASISKIFIGVALMRAIEQGLFTLETPINDILPFVVKNPAFLNQVIRIKHLATHTSGINDVEATYFANHSILTGENVGGVEAQRMINELKFKQNSMITPLKDFMKEYFTAGNALYSSKNFNPTEAGTAYRYSNIGAALAAYLIEVKTGQSFAEYCNAQIFNPLGMSSTSWFLTNVIRPKMATLYQGDCIKT